MAFDFHGGKRERPSVSKVSKSSWTPMDDRRYKYGAEFVCVFLSHPPYLSTYCPFCHHTTP
jgi:hypothetical protein